VNGSYSGKVAVVTGATAGIGRGHALVVDGGQTLGTR
jgi:NADP-dependent 3-hydroxy acid dehydrogenase YdfG